MLAAADLRICTGVSVMYASAMSQCERTVFSIVFSIMFFMGTVLF